MMERNTEKLGGTLSHFDEAYEIINTTKAKALAFDMDGTLFATERTHMAAIVATLRSYGLTPPTQDLKELEEQYRGKTEMWIAQEIVDHFKMDIDPLEFVERKGRAFLDAASAGPEWMYPEAKGLVELGKKRGMPMALVTSGEKMVSNRLLELAQIHELFDVILTYQDCPKHKPDPWPYAHACQQMGVHPEETLAFEDSTHGSESAMRAGLTTYLVKWFI